MAKPFPTACNCPTCGQPVAGSRMPVEMLLEMRIGGKRRRLLTELVRAYPKPVTRDALIASLYGDDPNGGPLCAEEIINILVSHLRKQLGPLGWTIPRMKPIPGDPAARQLVPLEVPS